MNLKEHFESQDNCRKFWERFKKGGTNYGKHSYLYLPCNLGWVKVCDLPNPLSDDVKLEVLVDLWNRRTMRSQSSRKAWIAWQGLSSAALREALITALMEVE